LSVQVKRWYLDRNLGRNTFEGPGLANVNASAIKAVHIPWFIGPEGATLELRGEIANLFNRVNLGRRRPTYPAVYLESPLGQGRCAPRSPRGRTRTVQLGLRIAF